MANERDAWALVMVWNDGSEDYYLPGIRSSRRDAISVATTTFYNGAHDWPYIKKMGWRVRKIHISEPRP